MKHLYIAAVLAFSLTLFTGCKEKKPQPEELLIEYMDLLNEEKYEEMYAYLTEEAKASIDQEAYVERYENISALCRDCLYTHLVSFVKAGENILAVPAHFVEAFLILRKNSHCVKRQLSG